MRKISSNDARLDREAARALLERLNHDAARIALRFQLRYQSIEAERPNVKSRYGICYADGRIQIRLRHVSTGRALRYSSLVNTLCHELAHLRHMNHGPRFKAFYFRILEWARAEGIYRPAAMVEIRALDAAPRPRTKLPAAARAVPEPRPLRAPRDGRAASARGNEPVSAPTAPSRPVQLALF